MKKCYFFLVILLLSISHVNAQRYAIVDMKYILDKIPDYKNIDGKLKVVATNWQRDIDNRQAEVDKMRKNFEAEQYMLSDELKNKREIEIFNKDKEVRNLQNRYFGYEGEFFKERERLVKPIQDKVFNAVQQMSLAHGFDYVLDRSQGTTVLYSDPKLNRSDEVLKIMGIKEN